MSSTAETAPSSTEARLERLEAIESARSVLARYAAACDAQDLEAIAVLFAPDSELRVPGHTYQGRDDVVSFYRQAWLDDPSQKTHFITNSTTEWLGAGGVAIDSYFLYTAAGDTSSVLGWGEYRDVVSASDGPAAFTRKSISIRRSVDVRDGWALSTVEARR